MKEQAEKLVEELEAINLRAFRMAHSVYQNSGLRSQMAGDAGVLQERLLVIAGELEHIHPDLRKKYFHFISESLLDLHFVREARDITSLRLGDIIKWGK